eukprot:TRINITY_DN5209_c0_g1_i1.p1 TRINITY_DN5209_c0_g1~~TRINITY_DN5209_c0_g1_i1.p1  ORF type:complete len:143 (+),score=44.37 TRINITY_DN5209_c0_g1_i1:119-547(+)
MLLRGTRRWCTSLARLELLNIQGEVMKDLRASDGCIVRCMLGITLKETGKEIREVSPLIYDHGKNHVIAGLELAASQLKVGQRATVMVPSRLAYGTEDCEGIPPNSDLVLDLEIRDVTMKRFDNGTLNDTTPEKIKPTREDD